MYQAGIERRVTANEQWIGKQNDGTLVWTIDRITERRVNREFLDSQYFYGKKRPYKMALAIAMNGRGNITGTGLTIRLYMYTDARDRYLKWPFEGDVSIALCNEAAPGGRKVITKHCIIQQPVNNNWESSEIFQYLYADLSRDLLLVDNCFTVECRVDLSDDSGTYDRPLQ